MSTPTTTPIENLRPWEAAQRLGISTRTVYRLIEEGRLTAFRVGKQHRLPAHLLPGADFVPDEAARG